MSRLTIDIKRKAYPRADREAGPPVLESLRLRLEEREFVCVLGPSGCGKTTLLNCVAGLDRDFAGRVDLPHVQGRETAAIGYVFQNPRLLPWLSVRQNIDLVLKEGAADEKAVLALLAEAGLEALQDAYPERLSLGQERRASIVRAFAVQPDVLLLDEPFVSLDEATAQRLRLLLLAVWRQRPASVLFVTHDLREAIFLADRIVLLSQGPATVVADIPVELPREERRSAQKLEIYRHSLVDKHPNLAVESVTNTQQNGSIDTEKAGFFSPLGDR